MNDFMINLTHDFDESFREFNLPVNIMMFARNPFTITLEDDFIENAKQLLPGIEEAALQFDIQTSSFLKQSLSDVGPVMFWSEYLEKFHNSRRIAILVLSMFGLTYTCESSFSHMNAIKRTERSGLSDKMLENCMKIVLTTYEPNFRMLARRMKCHFSH